MAPLFYPEKTEHAIHAQSFKNQTPHLIKPLCQADIRMGCRNHILLHLYSKEESLPQI